MPRKTAVKEDKTVYTVLVSGTAYENGIKERFAVKPSGERKRGFGYQVKYDLMRPDLRKLVDLMTELACDLADEFGDDSPKVDQIYKDLFRFPEAAGVR